MLYRFRVILDAEEDVFRDIEIMADNTLEDLHNVILQSFGFDGTEMASFYLSDDDWNQGEEVSQFDMDEEENSVRLMNETTLDDVVSETQTKLIYIYDFLSMWTFLVELAEIAEPDPQMDYPNLMFVHGQLPTAAPEKEFQAEDDDLGGEYDEDFDIDDYDDLSFDENWN
ncbi:IS1096 element passenger TnpR family protein [Salinimicrobium flavum]|uniref:Plasmid pRiA4b Orf3-like domain-containing protein n=1 Tax=Salinimicrobium flavum TaxID=1737065 RepID=A0ABW5IUM9_9FLAO